MSDNFSADEWLKIAKSSASSEQCGMFLLHNGVVRITKKSKARSIDDDNTPVKGILISSDHNLIDKAVQETYTLPGIYYVRVQINTGKLHVGDSIMYVLVGGDIRPHVISALEYLVEQLKTVCIQEKELFD